MLDACTFTRPDPDDARPTDPESGQPLGVPPDPVVVYSGACHVDERGEAIEREQGGDAAVGGEAVLRLPAVLAILLDAETDTGSVTFSGVTKSCRILRIRYLETQTRLLITWTERAT